MCEISDNRFHELKIARSYIKLLCLPDLAHGVKSVSLARIGNYEIRILEDTQTDSAERLLFWMELFDYGTQISIDSCRCHNIKEAVAAFEDFISQSN